PLYVVEFKGGRTDVFYTQDSANLICHVGDLVIVEADRGKDLGKVINDSITPHHIHLLQQSQMAESTTGDLRFNNKEIQPKRIYRLAQPSEIAILMSKNQDEAKAMLLCQTKVRQKKLPMEVVDAEYQWDRRKLTFYFVAERRIDFRELVRDLFKIYKTRIWMCAVNPNPITSLLCGINSTTSNNSQELTDKSQAQN
ncbi:PSP1-domain-containing protein, partial [Basidiobolus meristosporus CBS 931.73]